MISILIITPYNYANTQNKYAIAGAGITGLCKSGFTQRITCCLSSQTGQNQAASDQVNIQPDNIVRQGDKRTCCQSRVDFHFVQ